MREKSSVFDQESPFGGIMRLKCTLQDIFTRGSNALGSTNAASSGMPENHESRASSLVVCCSM
jgi:hypothetical protein